VQVFSIEVFNLQSVSAFEDALSSCRNIPDYFHLPRRALDAEEVLQFLQIVADALFDCEVDDFATLEVLLVASKRVYEEVMVKTNLSEDLLHSDVSLTYEIHKLFDYVRDTCPAVVTGPLLDKYRATLTLLPVQLGTARSLVLSHMMFDLKDFCDSDLLDVVKLTAVSVV
jgi:hypothetical protein